MSGHNELNLVRKDARDRSLRTFMQGLGVDLLIAVAGTLLLWVADADILTAESWTIFAAMAVKSVLMAAASYIMRLQIDPVDLWSGGDE